MRLLWRDLLVAFAEAVSVARPPLPGRGRHSARCGQPSQHEGSNDTLHCPVRLV